MRALVLLRAVAGILLLAATPLFAQYAPERAPIAGAWGPNGSVSATAVVGDTLFLAGRFDYIGPPTGAFGSVDSGDGSAAVTTDIAPDGVAVSSDGAGGWFVASRALLSVNGPQARVVHVLANGHRDPAFFSPNFDLGSVDAVAFAGGRLYVGGDFQTVNGATHRGLAALDPTSGFVLPWDPALTSAAQWPSVHHLAVDAGRLYAAGVFEHVGGAFRAGMAAFSAATGTLDGATFEHTAGHDAYWLSAAGGRVYAGGGCRTASGRSTQVCAYTADGSSLAGWDTNQRVAIQRFVATTTRVYVVTDGPGFGLNPVIASLDPVTGAADGWQSAPLRAGTSPGLIYTLAVGDDQVFVGGSFTDVGGARRTNLASFDATSGALRAWRPAVANWVAAIASDGTRVAVTGSFASIGGDHAPTIAALDLRTGRPAPLTLPAFPGSVDAITASGSLVVAASGATLVAFSGTTGTEFARLDIDAPGQPPGSISALAIDGPRLFLGGRFVSVLGRPRQHLAAIDLTTGQPTDWNPQPNEGVHRLWVSSGAVFAKGAFTAVPGLGRSGVAAWNAVTGAIETFAPPNVGDVTDLAFFRDRVLMTGAFRPHREATGTVWSGRITGELLEVAPPVPFLALGVARAGDTFVVGGNAVPGFHAAGVAAINASTGETLTWHPVLDGHLSASVDHVQATPQFVVLTGYFETVDGVPAHNLAIFRAARAGRPVHMTASVVGTTATVAWQPGTGAGTVGYSLEVGTSAGAADVGTFDLGTLTRATGSLPAGTYYARVRALGLNGPGAAGSEVVVSVPPVSLPPQAPASLAAAVSGSTITLNWTAAGGNATTYVIEAGTASGLANLGVLPTGHLDTTFATQAPSGTYVVRVRAANGFGVGPASNEVIVVVP